MVLHIQPLRQGAGTSTVLRPSGDKGHEALLMRVSVSDQHAMTVAMFAS